MWPSYLSLHFFFCPLYIIDSFPPLQLTLHPMDVPRPPLSLTTTSFSSIDLIRSSDG